MNALASTGRFQPGRSRSILPNTTQTTAWTCGSSALLAICSYFGVGPEDEWDFTADMKFGAAGSDPIHFVRAAKKYGLNITEYIGMTDDQLIQCIDAGQPVILMLQAWPNGQAPNYKDDWRDGHWIVAIGYDDQCFYFEDPSVHGGRGYIGRRELNSRWHDIEGSKKQKIWRLGLAIWADKITRFGSSVSARHID